MPITDAEKARQVVEEELRRQLRDCQALRTEAVIKNDSEGAPQLYCPFCDSDVIHYAEDLINHRTINRVDLEPADDAVLAIDGKDQLGENSDDERLICLDCSTDLKIPASLTMLFE